MKFIGHLDMVRYFQKVMRRANVDVLYSEGFSPHQKMSFAAPLSVGVLSTGEYFDIEVGSTDSSEIMMHRINEANARGVKVLSYKLLPDNAKTSMAIMTAADYKVYTDVFDENTIRSFISQDKIMVLKKTKKSEKMVDIKPMIHGIKFCDDYILMKIDQGSSSNLKPDLVMQSLADFSKITLPQMITYERVDMYYSENGKLHSLEEMGEIIE